MALLGMRDVGIAFGGPAILEGAGFGLERGERVCLLGRNGAGKSTLMKLLDGTIKPDRGEVIRQTGITTARLEQEIPDNIEGTIFEVAAGGLGDAGTLLTRYHDASHRVGAHASEAALRELDRLHHALEAANAWQLQTRVDTVLSHLGLDPDLPFAQASGGRRRQALLARALVSQPDVLLLDEPTNHLDIDAIDWLEDFLIGTERHAAVRHPRPGLSAAAGHAHRRARPRPPGRLGVRLRHLPRAQGGGPRLGGARSRRSSTRSSPKEEVVDPPGHQGPPHPQRGPRARARGAARGARRPPRADRHGAACRRRRPSAPGGW